MQTWKKEDAIRRERPKPLEPGRDTLGLSPLEEQAIALILAGYSIEEMAIQFGMSPPALRLHITNLCKKLSVSNELELLLFALYHRLLDTRPIPSSGD